MSDAPEPQFLSLKERIAALKQSQAADAAAPPQNNSLTIASARPRPPPPPPPKLVDRPHQNLRAQSTPNGGAISTTIGNQPAASVAPPPILDREIKSRNLRLSERDLPRKPPPPLPTRKSLAPSPQLPQRRPSDQLAIVEAVRKPSSESLRSTYSAHSTYSYGGTKSSASSVDTSQSRRLPPRLDEAELPPLPPSKRELEEKARLNRISEAKSNPTPSVPRITRQVTAPPVPTLPSRPSLPSRQTPILPSRPVPQLPSRPSNGSQKSQVPTLPARPRANPGFGIVPKTRQDDVAPTMLHFPATNGYNSHAHSAQPAQPPRPPANLVIELNSIQDFQNVVINNNKDVLLLLHAHFCKYCKAMLPDYGELGAMYAGASDKVTIAMIDWSKHEVIPGADPMTKSYPTIKLYAAGRKNAPVDFQWNRTAEMMSRFIKEEGSHRQGSKAASVGLTGDVGGGAPPPIPTSSRPPKTQIDAIRAISVAVSPPPAAVADPNSCLICRGFSGPDAVGAQYAREQLPPGSAVDYLAHYLCSPFTSLTDKARAIFSWTHHNIAYDVASFLSGNIKHQSAEEAIRSGLGVCENYARIYHAIATKAGLECVVVGGHGKGYGFDWSPNSGQPIPAYDAGHAWNAVKIDGGQWKLIDACWGAGNLGDDKQYHKKFSPDHFTSSNEVFGLKHYPENGMHQYREDGRVIRWEEYVLGPEPKGERVQTFGVLDKHGIDETSIHPQLKAIPASTLPSGSTRFLFQKKCQHWDFHRNGTGEPYLFVVKVSKSQEMGYCEDLIPFNFDGNGIWWVDVPNRLLGGRGEEVQIYTIDKMGGVEGRGLTKEKFVQAKGKAMNFGCVAKWEVV